MDSSCVRRDRASIEGAKLQPWESANGCLTHRLARASCTAFVSGRGRSGEITGDSAELNAQKAFTGYTSNTGHATPSARDSRLGGGCPRERCRKPPPVYVCGLCGGALADFADATGSPEDLRVERSTAIVHILDDGSGTWRVTNRLVNESAAAYLRGNPAALNRLVERGIEFSTVEGPPRNVSAAIDGTTMTVRFEDPNAASRLPGGVLVVEYFHTGGYDLYPVFTANQFTILGPEGTTATRGPGTRGRCLTPPCVSTAGT